MNPEMRKESERRDSIGIVRRSGTIALSWGRWGGFYLHRHRVCLGWFALTYVIVEVDDLMEAYVAFHDERNKVSLAAWRDDLVEHYRECNRKNIAEYERARDDRNRWIRAFNRIEKAVTNHIKDRCIDSDDLAHVHGAVLRDLGPKETTT